jgi:condensation enzyme
MSNEATGEGQFPLSFNQEFMSMFDQGDDTGSFGPRYHLVHGWRMRGQVDIEALHGALDDVVARNEILRTEVVRDTEDRYQQVHPASSTELLIRDLTDAVDRDLRAEELLVEIEASEYSVRELPLVRAVLGRFDDTDSVLALIVHHSAVDSWSMQQITREIAEYYAARREQRAPVLPDVPTYRDFVSWERSSVTDEALDRSRAYWRETLAGAQMPMVRTDFPRSAGLPKNTSIERYLVDSDVTTSALELARSMRSSPFMVLLAAYNILLRELTGSTDNTVLTITSGRGQARFEDTVGPFFNLLPLRTNIDGCRSFREVAERTRKTCLGAFSHAIPFAKIMAESPHIGEPWVGDHTAGLAFQVFQFPFVMVAQQVGNLECSEIRRRQLPAEVSTDIPDGSLWTLDIDPASNEMFGQVQFNSNQFHVSTVRDLISQFQQVIKQSMSKPD